MIHVHCGDSSAAGLRAAGPDGDVLVWSDILHEGPAPAGLNESDWRRLRAEFLARSSAGALTAAGCLRRLEDQDAALARACYADEVVLWFDACLYDQTILIRQLDWFARQPRRPKRLSLICAGEFPGYARFRGLGELTGQQLLSLLPERHPVTAAESAAAGAAWNAFRSPDPSAVCRWLEQDNGALPYLGPALRRHLEEFPAVKNGLGRLQRQALTAVADNKTHLGPLFGAVSDMESCPFFGDTTLWSCLNRLAQAEHPALAVTGPGPLPLWDPPPDLSGWRIALTRLGRELLDDRTDWIACNGIDCWRGGVHLEPGNIWRRDAAGQLRRQ